MADSKKEKKKASTQQPPKKIVIPKVTKGERIQLNEGKNTKKSGS